MNPEVDCDCVNGSDADKNKILSPGIFRGPPPPVFAPPTLKFGGVKQTCASPMSQEIEIINVHNTWHTKRLAKIVFEFINIFFYVDTEI